MRTMLTRFDPFLLACGDGDACCGTDCLSPAVDVREDATRLEITAELPGLARKDVEVLVKDGVLTLRGEKRREAEPAEGRAHRVERRWGAFARSFVLPETVDATAVEARFRDGVLTVVLPKRPESRPLSVEIRE
jgi:HSP20 family protein